MCVWVSLCVYNYAIVSICACVFLHVRIRLCVCAFMCTCKYVCVCTLFYFLFLNSDQYIWSLKHCWKGSFKTFILLGLYLALISFFGLNTVCSILKCGIMPTKTKLLMMMMIIIIIIIIIMMMMIIIVINNNYY